MDIKSASNKISSATQKIKESTKKITQSTNSSTKTGQTTDSKTTGQTSNSTTDTSQETAAPKQEDTVQLSTKGQETLNTSATQEKGIFESAYNWITGQQEDSDYLLNQEKLKNFKEKLEKEDPEKYKEYQEAQKSSEREIIESKNKANQELLGIDGEPDILNEDKVKEFEKKLKETDPEGYKKYKSSQESSQEKIDDSFRESKDTLKEGFKKSDYYLNVSNSYKSAITGVDQYELEKQNDLADKEQLEMAKNKGTNKEHLKSLMSSEGDIDKANIETAEQIEKSSYYLNPENALKYGITGVDQYEQDSLNREGEVNQDKLKEKDFEKYKSHMKDRFSSDQLINEANMESADGIQNMVDTVDVTLGGANKLVDAKNKFSDGDYKGAVLDTGEAGLRIVTSALLESGKAFEWGGKALNKGFKFAGPKVKNLFTRGDDLLKSIAPEAYEALKTSGSNTKNLLKKTLEKGGEITNKSLKSMTGKDIKEILEWANKPVKEIVSDAGEGIKKKFKGMADNTGSMADEVIDGGKDLKKSLGNLPENREIDINDMSFKDQEDTPDLKDFDEIIGSTKAKYKPQKLELNDKKIEFYGEKEEGKIIQNALDSLPDEIKNNLGDMKIYVDDYLYAGSQGISPGNLGLCRPKDNIIVLNRANLNKDLYPGYIYDNKAFKFENRSQIYNEVSLENIKSFLTNKSGHMPEKIPGGNNLIKDIPVSGSGDDGLFLSKVAGEDIKKPSLPDKPDPLEPKLKQDELLNETNKNKTPDSNFTFPKKSIPGEDPPYGDLDVVAKDLEQGGKTDLNFVGFADDTEGQLKKKQLKWQETFFHEVFHQYDYKMGKDGKYFSQIAGDAPWDKIADMHNITNYTKKVQKSYETAAESFAHLMNHFQDYKVINKGNFDMDGFMSYIDVLDYKENFKYIIKEYLDGKIY